MARIICRSNGLCRHASQRHGVLDVLVGVDGAAQGHRASAARHDLYASVLCARRAQAFVRGYLLFRAEDFLLVRFRQFDHLSGIARPGTSNDAAPTENGKVIELPKPYEKKIFGTEKQMSSDESLSTARA